jgi:hypothetical protein
MLCCFTRRFHARPDAIGPRGRRAFCTRFYLELVGRRKHCIILAFASAVSLEDDDENGVSEESGVFDGQDGARTLRVI